MKQLCDDLASYGHKVTIFTSFPHYDSDRIWERYRGKVWLRERLGNLDVFRLYIYVPKQKNWIVGRILNYASWNMLSTMGGILAGKQDIVFVPSPPLTNGIAGFAISRIRRVPFVYNVQDIYPDVAVRLGILKNARIINTFRSLERFTYSKAAAVSVISENFKCNLIRKGVPEDKLFVIPNFVDPEFIRPLPRHNRLSAAQGLHDYYIVLFAGNIGLSQGLEQVLETANILKGHPEIYFLIVGNGATKRSLISTAQRLRLRNVRFLPFLPHNDVPELYASSDVCLVPLKRGLTEESVPSKVYSILAAAKPLIASVDKDSDTWRLVKDADCGICIPPEDPKALADAILNLHRDRSRGLRMGENGRKFVESRFSRQRIAKEYERLFISVVSGER